MSDTDIEKIFNLVGSDGKYQKLLLWIFLVPLHVIIPWTVLVQIFQSSVPSHWCYVPGKPNNMSLEDWKNITIPWVEVEKKLVQSSCKQFIDLNDEHDEDMNHTNCKQGWSFDTSDYDVTLPSSQNWVCDADSKASDWLAVGLAGSIIGTLFMNSLSDLYGRKPLLILSTQIYAVFSLIRHFVGFSDELNFITMFLSSASFPPVLEVSLILVQEQVKGEWRTLAAVLSFLSWVAGMSLLSLLAYLTRNFIVLGIITSLPYTLYAACYWFLYESPRWLLSKGKKDEAMEILKKIAKWNGKDDKMLNQNLHNIIKDVKVVKENKLNYIDLFKTPLVRKRTILMTLTYAANNLVYYGLLYNTASISGNEFLNFFLMSITEIPANIFGWYGAQKFGRRLTGSAFFLLSSLSTGVLLFYLGELGEVDIAMLCISKMFITVSFLVIYIQIAEIYPTSHRVSGAGFSSIITSIVGTASPYIAYSKVHWSKLPYMVIVCLSLFGAIVSSFLPETLGVDIPQNVQEAEEYLVDQSYFYFPKRKQNFQGNENPTFTASSDNINSKF